MSALSSLSIVHSLASAVHAEINQATAAPTSNESTANHTKTTGLAGDLTVFILSGLILGGCLLVFVVALVIIVRHAWMLYHHVEKV
jgi:hypothetical protein